MRLSVLDQSPIRNGGTPSEAVAETIALAKASDRLGYHRYWLAEHHNTLSFAGSCPEILIARVAAETKRIRVGAGGVMLPHYSPLKVAEQFRMLETLAPGRIDLGLGRAPGADGRTTVALRAGPESWPIDAFPQQVILLRQFLEDAGGGKPLPDNHPYRGVHAMPRGTGMPEIWVLGSGVHGAVYAAELGLPYAHAHFINPDGSEEACAAYRERFKPGLRAGEPRVLVCTSALAAETDEAAQRHSATRNLWAVHLLTGRHIAFPSEEDALAYEFSDDEKKLLRAIERRSATGTADAVKTRLETLAADHGADELAVVTITHGFAARLKSYELLASAFGLGA